MLRFDSAPRLSAQGGPAIWLSTQTAAAGVVS